MWFRLINDVVTLVSCYELYSSKRALGNRIGLSCHTKKKSIVWTIVICFYEVCQQSNLGILTWIWLLTKNSFTINSQCPVQCPQWLCTFLTILLAEMIETSRFRPPTNSRGTDLHCMRRFVPRAIFPPRGVFLLLIFYHGNVLKLNLGCAYIATFLGGWNNKATGLEIRFPPFHS